VPFDGVFSEMHWLIVVLVAVLVFPPRELPRLANRAGRFLAEVKRYRSMLAGDLRAVLHEIDQAADKPSTSPDSGSGDGATVDAPT